MIHAFNYPKKMELSLLRSTIVQLDLLRFAAKGPTVDWPGLKTDLQLYYGKDAVDIAVWAETNEQRKKALETFAAATGTTQAKRNWLNVLEKDVYRLLSPRPSGKLVPFSKYDPAKFQWVAAAGAYLRTGYEAFRTGGIPQAVAGRSVKGYDYIREFRTVNPDVYICPACDGSRQIDSANQKKPFSSLDHYLPKQIYPHLALHPRNLVPVCAACNSKKGQKDPLENVGGRLLGIDLPYDCPGWKEKTYAQVNVTGMSAAAFTGVVPDNANEPPAFVNGVGVDLSLYQVLERWNGRSPELAYRLFRRARQYFMGTDLDDRRGPNASAIRERLDRLLGYWHEEIGMEPDAYALTWWLATLAKSELTQTGGAADKSPLAKEIAAWVRANHKRHKQYSEKGKDLRGKLP